MSHTPPPASAISIFSREANPFQSSTSSSSIPETSTMSITTTQLHLFVILLCSLHFHQSAALRFEPGIRMPTEPVEPEHHQSEDVKKTGTRWAVLVAGSSGYGNYRHQADVCHAYQILKKGGLKDENIVVFMYDDIANNELNPRPGVIINHPNGSDVYAGVPKVSPLPFLSVS